MLLSVKFGNFSPHMRSFDNITISGLESDVILEFSAPVFLYRRGYYGARHHFRRLVVTIMSAHAQ